VRRNEPEVMSDQELGTRLRQREPARRLHDAALWGGAALALSALLPYDAVDGQLVFTWQLFTELGAAGILAALGSSLLGLTLLVARRWLAPAALAATVLAALLVMVVWTELGSDAEAWGLLAVPDSVGQRSPLLVFALAALGAGLSVVSDPATRRKGQVLLFAASGAMLLFFAWPSRGETPGGALLHLFLDLLRLPDWRRMLGHLLFAFVLIFPLGMGIFAFVHGLRPALRFPWYMLWVPIVGLPAFMLVLVFRRLLLTFGDTSIVTLSCTALLLLALTELLASALAVLAVSQFSRGNAVGVVGFRGLLIAASVAALLITVQVVLARPPEKGIAWSLDAASENGDRVFGERLSAWNTARFNWDAATRNASSARHMVSMQAAARELLEGTATFGNGVSSALRRLTLESRDLDLAGRRWARLVSEVNRANQQARLPYYLDPSVSLEETADGVRRSFNVVGYRIEAVEPVHLAGKPFATLHVKALGDLPGRHGVLGFSRDWQPFALVVSDEVDASAKEFEELARTAEPHCTSGDDAAVPRVRELCQRILRASSEPAGSLRSVIERMTERHELQHQFDGPHLPLAPPLSRRLIGVRESDQDRVNRELSAYLAEMTIAEAQPKFGLVWLLRFGMGGGFSVYPQIATLAFGALLDRELGGSGLLVNGHEIQDAFTELAAEEDSALRTRAKDAWERLFGMTLPSLE
jgi:hypothetical protein